jgi:hypothetical protein
MQFTLARPDTIRAINQRWLLKFWMQYIDSDRVPRWQAVKPDDLASLADHLSLLDVTGGAQPRFLIRFHGRLIAPVYGAADCRGRFIDEFMRPERHDEALAPYRHAVQSGAPVYTIHDITDAKGRVIHFERLLLPFARDGETVDRILAAFEFVCVDGHFDSSALRSAVVAPPTVRLAAIIEIPAMA